MLGKVVVGVDGHEGGRAAIALARMLAPAADLLLVSAYPFESATSRALVLGYGRRLREDAESCLKTVASEAGLDERCAEVVADTSPARALHGAAERHGAHLIVVGSAHHGRFGRVLLGDVSRSVLHDAPCPVAVAPLGFPEGALARIVGVGFDGSPEADAALRFAASLAEAADGRLRVLDVTDEWQPLWSGGAYPSPEIAETLRAEAHDRVVDAIAGLSVPADADAVTGVPSVELSRLGREVDLVVVGSRGYGPVRRTVLGSTSDRLIHDATCPVVVVPRGVAVEEDGARGAVAHATA